MSGWSDSQKEQIRKVIMEYADMRSDWAIQLHKRDELDEVLVELEAITQGEA